MRYLYIGVGCVAFVLGSVGVVVPVLPSIPFYLVTAYCFSRSSRRLHDWFCGTRLYKDELESYVQKKGMQRRTKLRILGMVSLLMGVGFLLMHSFWGRLALAAVWLGHVIYFVFVVKEPPEE
ncbi:YbaN family protein [Olsenella urininfantis]|uniref:YbaN family protein n=1 Tax=Olsenella urininfantis TaxID=1871033 RepID=UPI0009847302|nr:YbaN family protein [Olsenella urininfantis]